jgi:hypothetical protein
MTQYITDDEHNHIKKLFRSNKTSQDRTHTNNKTLS